MGMSDEMMANLERDITRKLREKRALIAESEGPITIKLFPKGRGFDIKLTLTS